MSPIELFWAILRDFRLFDLLDILLVSWVIYRVLLLIEGTRAFNLLKGLAIIFLLLIFTRDLDFHAVNWVLANTLPTGFLALVVIFQPELRRALEDIGRGTILADQFHPSENIGELVEELAKTIENCSKKRIGALIVFEQDIGLKDFIDKGVPLHSHLTSELLNTIFMPFTPLHDGAVIVKGGYVEAASCFLPISQNPDLAREVGTRHRAAVGITEITDALVLIVSEETGTISFAKGGKLIRDLTMDRVRDLVRGAFKRVIRGRRMFQLT
ncbi:MAG: Diadenylate cyclase spyDAC [Candidatus Ozemobacter sibiricus]|uniref:Diadenylate cyclase n=1 Tax=Candidatus Ozemobacter sibiricus TaxID=2268124 RepID=A0A367ZRM3_9BACT|nr:MAG: Diadenylate cyclase spyDAC [Candidatus Ozemobacter sibiricus]